MDNSTNSKKDFEKRLKNADKNLSMMINEIKPYLKKWEIVRNPNFGKWEDSKFLSEKEVIKCK